MKKTFLVASVLCSLLACNNSGKGSKETTDTSGTTVVADTSVTNEGARTFITTVANSGMAEVEIASYAHDNAQSAGVKDFAEMLHHDHSALNDQVKTLAAQNNISLPDTMSADKRKMVDDLKKKSGKEFDIAFVDAMLHAHQTGIALFETTAGSEIDADIRNFASLTLPKLREHLNMAIALQKK